jgi:DNA-binding winged helix-turn-helix (wHTH) protein/Flp pilus assembly protein TadD
VPIYTFGPFQLDGETRRLTRGAETMTLSDRHLEVLLQLVMHPGSIVTKDALIDAAWGDVAVTDNSLEQAVSLLRRTLGDAESRPFIETVPRRGYRFVQPVTREVRRETDEGLAALLAPHRAWLEGRNLLETLERDQVSAAEAAFTRAVAALPDLAVPHIGLANANAFRYEATRLHQTRDVEALRTAVQHAREACRLEPGLAEAWATLGFVLSRAGHSEDALAASRRAIALEPDNWRHQLRLAFVSWGEERLRAANRALRLLPGLGLAHFLAATVHVARQSFDAAEREIDAGITAQEKRAEATSRFTAVGLHWLNGLLRLQRGDEAGAAAAFDRELASGASAHLYGAECCAHVHYARGARAWQANDRGSAAACFAQALAAASGYLPARAALATLTEARGDAPDPSFAALVGRLREQRFTIDVAIALEIPRIMQGDEAAAAAAIEEACLTAPPGSQGWQLPLDPLIAAHRHPEVWAGALAALRSRAA